MKKIILCFGLLLCLAGVTARNRKIVPVILTAGQSNADGRVPMEDFPSYITYNYCQWSYGSGDFVRADGNFAPFRPTVGRPDIAPRWGFDAIVYYMLEQQWQCPFYVIKQTMGGTAIDTLCSGSTHGYYWSTQAKEEKSLLKAFTSQIDQCLDNLPENYEIKFLLWHQGESDKQRADYYYDNLHAVIAYLRQYLVERTGRKRYAHLPVVCGTFAKGSRQGCETVANALYRMEREDKHFHVVDASDLTLQQDYLHFDAKGAQTLAERVVGKLKQIKGI